MAESNKVQIVIEAQDKASDAFKGVNQELGRIGPVAQTSSSQANAALLSFASSAVAASTAVAAAVKAIKFGDEFSQSMFRLTATFRESTGDVIAQAQKISAATRQAIGVQEVADAMSRTADSMKRYGLEGSQYMDMVSRATDVAAAKGLDLIGAMSRIESAMRGEAEASEYLGLTLNDTYMKNVAFGGSLRDTWEKLGDLEKAQYRYTELMKQSEKYSGTAAASTNTLGGALNALANDIRNQAGPALAEFSKDLAYVINIYRQGFVKGTAPGFTEMFDFGVTGFGKQKINRQGLIDSFAGNSGELTGGSPFQAGAKTQDLSAAQRVWDDYKKTAENAIKKLASLGEEANKKYVSSLRQSLDQAIQIREDYAKKVKDIEKSIEDNKKGSEDMQREIKRRGMTPEQAQKDLESEARSKRSASYDAASKGDFTKAIGLAKEAQQISFNLNNQEKAASGVRSATMQLNQVLEQQKMATQAADQEVQKYADGLQSKLDAAKNPAKALKQEIDSINDALKAAGQTPLSIDTSAAVSNMQRLQAEIDTVMDKLDEFIQKANAGGDFTVTFKGQASPVKGLSQTISDVMNKLNSLPTGSNYQMNFTFGLGSSIFGKSAYSASNRQYYALMDKRQEVVSYLENLGMSADAAMGIFNQYASEAWDRLRYAGDITRMGYEYVPAFRQSNEYNLGAMNYAMSQKSNTLYDMIASSLSGGQSSAYGAAQGGGGTEVNIERAIDVGSIIVNLNGGASGIDNARIVAEELDAQLAEMVASNRSRLRAALKANWG